MKFSRIRDRTFPVSLTASLLFHLSMVTLFRIVIYFPREDIEYFNVAIVEASAPVAPAGSASSSLEVPSAESMFDRFEQRETPLEPESTWGNLPAIQLPTLKFEEMDILRIQRDVLETRSRYEDFFAEKSSDTWSRFGRQLNTVGQTISRITRSVPPVEKADPLLPISRPAPGYEAYLEWFAEPRDRQAVAVHPIKSLWGLDPGSFSEPLALAFRVDRSGRVVDILDPIDPATDLLIDSVDALMHYRFEPLIGDGPATQAGTLIIRAGTT